MLNIVIKNLLLELLTLFLPFVPLSPFYVHSVLHIRCLAQWLLDESAGIAELF